MLDDEPFDECVERLAQKYRCTSTNYFDTLTDKYPLRFERVYIQKLYDQVELATNTIKKINVRKLLVCVCIVLDNEGFCDWDSTREMIYILVYMWLAKNQTVSMNSFEIDMYMPIIAGDIINLKKSSRVCLSFCRRPRFLYL